MPSVAWELPTQEAEQASRRALLKAGQLAVPFWESRLACR